MAVDAELLKILVCPEDKSPVALADSSMLDAINSRIEKGLQKNRAGNIVKEKVDGGLVRKDWKYLYPIREDIPVMLIEEAIAL